MKLEIEIKMNQTLEDLFLEDLRDQAAGMMTEDRREMETLIHHIERTEPEDWNDHAKAELGLFLMYRAGFQSAAGYMAEEFEE